MESGTPFCPWAVAPPGLARRRAKALSTIAGCPKNSKYLLECLRKLPAEELVKLYGNFYVNTPFTVYIK